MTSRSTARIVVGFDGSHSSMAALHWAALQAASTGSTIELVMTWEWPMDLGWPPALPEDYSPEAIALEELKSAEQRVREMHGEINVRSHLVHGRPGAALVEASWDAALLVVGSQNHGELTRTLFGSVRNHCVAHAHCPVLVFHFTEQRTRQPAPILE